MINICLKCKHKLQRYKRKNVVNNVDMSSLRAPLQNGPYIKTIHRTTQIYVEHQDATNIYKRPLFQVSVLVICFF